MRILKKAVLIVLISVLVVFSYGSQNPEIIFKTGLGDFVVEIYENEAPVTAANFLRYVDEDRFEGAVFYRVVTMENQPNSEIKIEVIQGGLGYINSDNRLDQIEHETTDQTGILHKDGVISMARGLPGSASSEFFICINDQPELDFEGRRNSDGQGFAAFGKVIIGMEVVRKIQKQQVNGQMLELQVKIHSISRKK